jgi:predicted nucleic acid-binding protein
MAAESTSRATNFMNAIDTNVFVYAFDLDEPVKRAKAHELLDRLTLRPVETALLWQVAGELLNCLRKWESAGRMSAEDVEANFRDVVAMFAFRVPSAATFAISFDLRSRYSLSHWDSMLVAGCKEAGIDLLFTEDLAAGTDYDGVRIVNPFA